MVITSHSRGGASGATLTDCSNGNSGYMYVQALGLVIARVCATRATSAIFGNREELCTAGFLPHTPKCSVGLDFNPMAMNIIVFLA